MIKLVKCHVFAHLLLFLVSYILTFSDLSDLELEVTFRVQDQHLGGSRDKAQAKTNA